MKVLLAAAVALVAGVGVAQAQRISSITGGQLGNICVSKDKAKLEACDAYLEGVSDTLNFYQFLMPANGSKGGKLPDYVCIPGPTTGVQLREAFVAWLRTHKDAERQAASQASMRAFNDTYKCKGE